MGERRKGGKKKGEECRKIYSPIKNNFKNEKQKKEEMEKKGEAKK